MESPAGDVTSDGLLTLSWPSIIHICSGLASSEYDYPPFVFTPVLTSYLILDWLCCPSFGMLSPILQRPLELTYLKGAFATPAHLY